MNAVTSVFAHRVVPDVLLIPLEEVNALRFREISFVFYVFERKEERRFEN